MLIGSLIDSIAGLFETSHATTDDWLKIGLSCGCTDEREAERAIARIYNDLGLHTPKFIWFDSPMAMYRAILTSEQDVSAATIGKVISKRAFRSRAMKESSARRLQVRRLAAEQADIRSAVWTNVGKFVADGVVQEVAQLKQRARYVPAKFIDDVGSLKGVDHGQHDIAWLYTRSRDPETSRQSLQPYFQIIKNVGWFIPTERVAFVTRKHTSISLDEKGLPHNESAAAIQYADGNGVYAWHGRIIPETAVKEPTAMTKEFIDRQSDPRLKQWLIRRYGMTRYMVESGAFVIQGDRYGTLYRERSHHDNRLYVRVINSTPEPDGTRNEYFLRVPTTMRTAEEAVAWTFNLQPGEYRPDVET